ncbi:hypothetical protein [Niallia sp. 03190]|uniref:hypothetical protein n=1 Tax=Niallia sp. 03190 TaxID=3458061 RepID=UPI004043D568
MSWERKALESMILKAIEQEKEYSDKQKELADLGVTLDIGDFTYDILTELMSEWDVFTENLHAIYEGELSKEKFLTTGLKYIEQKFNK